MFLTKYKQKMVTKSSFTPALLPFSADVTNGSPLTTIYFDLASQQQSHPSFKALKSKKTTFCPLTQ